MGYDSKTSRFNLIKVLSSKKLEEKFFLAEVFDKQWSELFTSHIKHTKSIYLLTTSKAGFSNTRVVYVWSKSHADFYNNKLELYYKKLDSKIDFLNQPTQLGLAVLDSCYTEIQYFSEPRINLKIPYQDQRNSLNQS